MAAGLNNSLSNWFLVNLFHLMGFKYKEYFISLLRAFPGGISLDKLRLQPSAMLLEFMLYRLSRVKSKDFRMIKLKGDFVSSNLPSNVFVPGQRADIKSYWLFPLIVVSMQCYDVSDPFPLPFSLGFNPFHPKISMHILHTVLYIHFVGC